MLNRHSFVMAVSACVVALVLTAPAPAHADTYTQTKYPIVLAHGLAGSNDSYFYGIADALHSGGAIVYVTDVWSFNSNETRGEQLLEQIERIVAETGCGKVNIIAHSQGGFDARYVLAARPDLVASLTTVGTPHQGSEVADYLRAHLTPNGFDEQALGLLADAVGWVIQELAGTSDPEDAIGALDSLSSAGAAAFNARYPLGLPTTPCGEGPASVNQIPLYSWGGTGVLTNLLDPTDGFLGLSSLAFRSGEANDGLVGQCSSHFGTVLRDNYDQNHLDEVNAEYGLVAFFSTSPKTLYRTHANRLKNAGL